MNREILLWAIIIVIVLIIVRVGCASQPSLEGENTDLIAAVLILEAGGEKDPGMAAVLEVIRNRQAKRKGWTMTRVVLQPKQFSCLNNISPERAVQIARKHPKWEKAKALLSAPATNYVGKCDHYYASSIKAPSWAMFPARRQPIGNHIFIELAPKIKLNTKHPGGKR